MLLTTTTCTRFIYFVQVVESVLVTGVTSAWLDDEFWPLCGSLPKLAPNSEPGPFSDTIVALPPFTNISLFWRIPTRILPQLAACCDLCVWCATTFPAEIVVLFGSGTGFAACARLSILLNPLCACANTSKARLRPRAGQ